MRRVLRVALRGSLLGAVLGTVAMLAAVLARSPGDPALWPPAPGEQGVAVTVVDHGLHAGLILRVPDLRAAAFRLAREDREAAHVLRAVAADFPAADWLEIGWGDAGFYRSARQIGDVSAGLALNALLWPTPSVLQVVPGWGPAETAFAGAPRVTLRLSEEGMAALARELAETFARDAAGTPQPDGASLYGAGAFYAGVPAYHLLRTCNHWISGLLRAAGVPSSWAFSATSAGLVAELGWRAG